MKEINAYQSDDGKFIGTKEQVSEYEKKQKLEALVESFNEDADKYGDNWFGLAVQDNNVEHFIEYLNESPDFREFVKLVYGFQEGEDKDNE